jgi:hypothetical protein
MKNPILKELFSSMNDYYSTSNQNTKVYRTVYLNGKSFQVVHEYSDKYIIEIKDLSSTTDDYDTKVVKKMYFSLEEFAENYK